MSTIATVQGGVSGTPQENNQMNDLWLTFLPIFEGMPALFTIAPPAVFKPAALSRFAVD